MIKLDFLTLTPCWKMVTLRLC